MRVGVCAPCKLEVRGITYGHPRILFFLPDVSGLRQVSSSEAGRIEARARDGRAARIAPKAGADRSRPIQQQ